MKRRGFLRFLGVTPLLPKAVESAPVPTTPPNSPSPPLPSSNQNRDCFVGFEPTQMCVQMTAGCHIRKYDRVFLTSDGHTVVTVTKNPQVLLGISNSDASPGDEVEIMIHGIVR